MLTLNWVQNCEWIWSALHWQLKLRRFTTKQPTHKRYAFGANVSTYHIDGKSQKNGEYIADGQVKQLSKFTNTIYCYSAVEYPDLYRSYSLSM